MELQSIGLAGLEKAQDRLAAVAKRLSGASSSAGPSQSVDQVDLSADQVDLSAEMVALLEAKNLANTNLKLVETANELAANTIDILG
jgi:hypothetical protein